MTWVASALVLLGGGLSVLAAVGLWRFPSTATRLHAAGKASPVAYIAVAAGAALEFGWAGSARLVLAVTAMMVTLPVGVHLLFRTLLGADLTGTASEVRPAPAEPERSHHQPRPDGPHPERSPE